MFSTKLRVLQRSFTMSRVNAIGLQSMARRGAASPSKGPFTTNSDGKGPLNLFDDSTWESMNRYMNRISSHMDEMRESMEERMRVGMGQMGHKMQQIGQAVNDKAIQAEMKHDTKKGHFHSCESYSYFDSNGTRVSHMKSHEKLTDGKELIKEERRVGDQRHLTEKSKNNDKDEWTIEEKKENIGDNQESMLKFDESFEKIFGKSKQKSIETGKEKTENAKK